ncbi:MAG: hypothetical protein KKD18_07270 [Nanoarchaeota archaeon]|nr:hypothetical protein [Nanoarchaeota archaeon]
MKNLQDLQEKVEKMLDGEKKRRRVAYEFVEQAQKILTPIASDLWGGINEHDPESTDAVYVGKSDIYFRWGEHIADGDNCEMPGFYFVKTYQTYWGENITDVYGSHFWYAIRSIVEWLPVVIEFMNTKEISRDKLIALLK